MIDEKEEAEVAEIDETAEKAKEIGEAMGAQEEDAPDYDVQEESDDRLAKTREEKQPAEKLGHKELTNQEKRALRKKRMRDKFNEKDAIIAEQNRQLQEVNARLSEVDGKLSNLDKAQLDKALNDNITAFNQANKDHTDAFKDGDGEKATKAMRDMYAAQKNIDELKAIKQQSERQVRQPAQPQQLDSSVIAKRRAWEKDNAWFKEGDNEESDIATAIAGRLVKEGYDAKSDDFWEELDERVAKRLPHLKEESDDDDYDEEPVKRVAKKRASPPINGGANRGDIKGKVTVSLPTAFINTLKDNGLWDQKEKRDKLIKRYLDGVKNNQGN